MSRYIDADDLRHRVLYFADARNLNGNHEQAKAYNHCLCMIDEQKTADVVEVTPCEECIHAKQHSYAPAECQWYCTLSLQYHGGRFFCACGDRGTDLLEWLHRGDGDE